MVQTLGAELNLQVHIQQFSNEKQSLRSIAEDFCHLASTTCEYRWCVLCCFIACLKENWTGGFLSWCSLKAAYI